MIIIDDMYTYKFIYKYIYINNIYCIRYLSEEFPGQIVWNDSRH